MPTISRFYGILIRMYHKGHAPPHFHAWYGDHDASIRIADFEVMEGRLPTTALKLVKQWAADHQSELVRNWDLASDLRPLLPIEPLD